MKRSTRRTAKCMILFLRDRVSGLLSTNESMTRDREWEIKDEDTRLVIDRRPGTRTRRSRPTSRSQLSTLNGRELTAVSSSLTRASITSSWITISITKPWDYWSMLEEDQHSTTHEIYLSCSLVSSSVGRRVVMLNDGCKGINDLTITRTILEIIRHEIYKLLILFSFPS